MEGKTALGASSPAKPALQSPDPLSQTRAVLSSSSHIFYVNVLRPSRQQTALWKQQERIKSNNTQVAPLKTETTLEDRDSCMKATSTSKEAYGTGLAITRPVGPYERAGFLLKAWEVSTMSARGLYALEIIQGIPEETSSPVAWADRSGSSKCLSKFGHRNPRLGVGGR